MAGLSSSADPAGPSSSAPPSASSVKTSFDAAAAPGGNIWQEILAQASRAERRPPKKHLLVLGESYHVAQKCVTALTLVFPSGDRNRGKRTLVERLIGSSRSSLSVQPTYTDAGPSASSSTERLARYRNNASVRGKGKLAAATADGEGSTATDWSFLDDERLKATEGSALAYEWVDVGRSGDVEDVPPLSIYTCPAYERQLLDLVPAALPKQCLSHLAIVIVLDWMHPQSMIEELLRWLSWIEEEFTGKMMEMVGEKEGRKEEVEGRDRLETFIRRYIEPKVDGSSDAVAGLALSNGQTTDDDLVALPEGVLTHNRCGLPIVIACTKADRIDATGDALISKGLVAGKGYISSSTGADGPKSWTWDERVDWVQQTLRTVAMKYGAALCYTSMSHDESYENLRSYLLHRLYAVVPPARNPSSPADARTFASTIMSTRFPYIRRANVLDRETLLVPTGWDSRGKIKVVRDGFDPKQIGDEWETGLERVNGEGARRKGGQSSDYIQDDSERSIEQAWREVLPVADADSRQSKAPVTKQSEPEQAFLSRQLELLARDPNRDPRRSLRQHTSTSQKEALDADDRMSARSPGVIGPVASTGLNLPAVEQAFTSMVEGKTKEPSTPVPTSTRKPTTPGEGGATSNEVLNNFVRDQNHRSGCLADIRPKFQGLIAGRRTPAAKSPGAEQK